jgi:hypothetical protein
VTAADVVWSFEEPAPEPCGADQPQVDRGRSLACGSGLVSPTPRSSESCATCTSCRGASPWSEAKPPSSPRRRNGLLGDGSRDGDSVDLAAFAGCWRGAPRLRKARFVARTMVTRTSRLVRSPEGAEPHELVRSPEGAEPHSWCRRGRRSSSTSVPRTRRFRSVSPPHEVRDPVPLDHAYLGFDLHDDATSRSATRGCARAVARARPRTIRRRAGAGFVPTQLVPPMVWARPGASEAPDVARRARSSRRRAFPKGSRCASTTAR